MREDSITMEISFGLLNVDPVSSRVCILTETLCTFDKWDFLFYF